MTAGVSRGHSTGSHEPVNTPEGLTTREGLNLAGRHDHRWSCPGALRPIGRAWGSDHRGRERVLLNPQGLPGTAGRGPACQACPGVAAAKPDGVGAGRSILPATRLGDRSPCRRPDVLPLPTLHPASQRKDRKSEQGHTLCRPVWITWPHAQVA